MLMPRRISPPPPPPQVYQTSYAPEIWPDKTEQDGPGNEIVTRSVISKL